MSRKNVFISSASPTKRSMCVFFDVSWHQHKNLPLFPCHGFFAQANLENVPHQRDRKNRNQATSTSSCCPPSSRFPSSPLRRKGRGKMFDHLWLEREARFSISRKKSRTLMKLNSHLLKKSTKQEPTNKHLSLCKPYSI